MAANYSIIVDAELNTKTIQTQLNNASKNLKVTLDAKDAINGAKDLQNSMEDVSLTFQAANEIFSTSIDIITSMVEEVYKLDNALIEFQKVSDLSGQSLDKYVATLSEMGSTVAITGKPKCQAPDDGIVNQHQEPLEIQYSLRAYSTTMVA